MSSLCQICTICKRKITISGDLLSGTRICRECIMNINNGKYIINNNKNNSSNNDSTTLSIDNGMTHHNLVIIVMN